MSENKTNGQIQIADEVVGVIATTAAQIGRAHV